jgi:hypothetical protein
VVILASPKTLGHSPSEIGGEDDVSALVEPADRMKEELFAGLREEQVAFGPSTTNTRTRKGRARPC